VTLFGNTSTAARDAAYRVAFYSRLVATAQTTLLRVAPWIGDGRR
jgi:hypothetical protein